MYEAWPKGHPCGWKRLKEHLLGMLLALEVALPNKVCANNTAISLNPLTTGCFNGLNRQEWLTG